ncbi:hypothetical protein ALC60_14132 [Trachymyrmex zeteki]|uniref:Uncharacterized protein n=1 Tax=Mycetomoellerius zeteki TaxID=64791 RepID=A0A151WG92_9HYME|nr:hypothetical protein ALC60_14132 [Trachymyrmex zeteki]
MSVAIEVDQIGVKMRERISVIHDGKSNEKGNADTINKSVTRSFVRAIVVKREKVARSAQLGSLPVAASGAYEEHVKLRTPRPPKPPSDAPTRYSVYTIP